MTSTIEKPYSYCADFYHLTANEEATIKTGGYGGVIVLGLLQMVGHVCLLIYVSNGIVSAKDLITGEAFSNGNLTFRYSTNRHGIVISSTYGLDASMFYGPIISQ